MGLVIGRKPGLLRTEREQRARQAAAPFRHSHGREVSAGERLSLAQTEAIRRLAIASPVDPLSDLCATGLSHFQAFFERMRSLGCRQSYIERSIGTGRLH
jgi:hypothetical protein